MRDPHDNHTIDLVEQAKRPLTAAERQKRHREKKKREREEGRRVVMEFTAEELMILAAVAGADAQKAEEKAPGSWWDRSITACGAAWWSRRPGSTPKAMRAGRARRWRRMQLRCARPWSSC